MATEDGVVGSTAGIIIPRACTLTGGSIKVNAADASRAFDMEILKDSSGTPTVLATIALAVSATSAYSSSLSVAIAAGDEIGIRIVRTSGSGPSTFNSEVVSAELTV